MDRDDAEARRKVEARRERLRALMDRLEAGLAEPPEAPLDTWRDRVIVIADNLATAVDDHIRDTEGVDGFFDEMLDTAPRLSDRVDQLRLDHRTLARDSAAFRATLDGNRTDELVDVARSTGKALLEDLERHRDLGAELLYECYWVDVAAGD